ncbi:unnamed protein product [Nippostrongylus brasiliensis]|uniref:C2H2-type domain-containing protein n=1 Tax=Nippostrongylus brasiliensis TaxID=27835 RepID=A0A158QY85_NIPBR|nr:unnamed protein product [Nippostrongylus brasiliensis]
MYLLLHLKDASRLSDVVQLLAKLHLNVLPEEIDLTQNDDLFNGQNTSSKDVEQANAGRRSLRLRSKSATDATSAQLCKTNMEEEIEHREISPKEGDAMEKTELSVTSALELFCHASTTSSNHDDLELDIEESQAAPQPSKRSARIEELGLETFQCQLCKKTISRQGQYANLVNHLSRHARLHASRKQYCCPVCRASFSRRYLAYSHVREAHPKHGFVEPVDHGRELREEYRALLEVCFPGANSRRKSALQAATSNGSSKSTTYSVQDSPTHPDELGQLLQQ